MNRCEQWGSLGAMLVGQGHPEDVAVVTEACLPVTYQTLQDDVSRLAGELEANTLILMLFQNSYASCVGYLAALSVGSVPIAINASGRQSQFAELLERFKPTYVYAPKNIDVPIQGWETGSQFEDYGVWRSGNEADYVVPDDLALMLSTSGSTSGGKMVRITAGNLISNTRTIVDGLGVVRTDRVVTTLPMAYTYGLSMINTHLAVGGSIAFTDESIISRPFWEFFEKVKPTTFGGVPYTYEMLRKLKYLNRPLPSLRYITQAGGKLTKNLALYLHETCTRNGVELVIMYGQTEATARMSLLHHREISRRPGSIGRAIAEGEFVIENGDGQVVEEFEQEGELIYYGPNVAPGYANDRFDLIGPDSTRGRLETGDLGYQDADGFLYVTGRKKRFIKIHGSRVNLDIVTETLQGAGLDVVCVGVDDELTVCSTEEVCRKTVLGILKTFTTISTHAVKIRRIDSFPRNESGKILYAQIVQECPYGA